MKIINLQAENIKRLKAVEITPQGNAVVLGGDNGAGKSSVLDSIMMALGGGRTVCEQPIREGETRASIRLDLGQYVVERKFTKGKSYLTVTQNGGAEIKAPQAMLDDLIGSLSFDPLAFDRLDKKARLEALRKIAGIDTTQIDADIELQRQERAIASKKCTQSKARWESLSFPSDAPAEEVSISELSEKLEQERRIERDLIAKKAERHQVLEQITKGEKMLADCDNGLAITEKSKALVQAIKADDATIEDIQKEIERLTIKLQHTKSNQYLNTQALKDQHAADRKLVEDGLTTRRAKLDNLAREIFAIGEPKIAEAADALNNGEARNQAARARIAKKQANADFTKAEAERDEIQKDLEKLENDKRKMLQSGKFPVAGLGLTEDGVSLDGVPWEQASSAQRLKASVSMGLALNPKLRILLVRDAALLDSKAIEEMKNLAETADAQLWIERVGSGPEVTVLIEEGEVVNV